MLAAIGLDEAQFVGKEERLAVFRSDFRQSLSSGWMGMVKKPSSIGCSLFCIPTILAPPRYRKKS
jgi:hypothetical protein